MKTTTLFSDFWSRFGNKSIASRQRYFNSLTKQERKSLISSFYTEGWNKFFAAVYMEYLLNNIKVVYDIDIIDMRIQAIKFGRVFLIEKIVWDHIEKLILEWKNLYDTDTLFGGLSISNWGKNKQFCKIKAKHIYRWR